MNVTFKEAVVLFFKRYATFKGRSTRAEFWWVQLFFVLIFLLLLSIGVAVAILGGAAVVGVMGVVALLWVAVLLVPICAVLVRRFHDVGLSGWWLFCSLVVGGVANLMMENNLSNNVELFFLLVVSFLAELFPLIVYLLPSAPDNRYGPNPYGEQKES